MGVDKYACFMQMYIYIFITGNQLSTQNNDKYCPKTLTGTAFSIKKAQIITWQTEAQQGDLWVTIEPIFTYHEVRGQGTPFKMAMPVYPRQNLVQVWSVI